MENDIVPLVLVRLVAIAISITSFEDDYNEYNWRGMSLGQKSFVEKVGISGRETKPN